MKTLHLHIGSYKTGTTSIQQTFCNNRTELSNQGFMYPATGRAADHQLLFFKTQSPEEHWPIKFKSINVNNEVLEKELARFYEVLERDLISGSEQHIISTEYLFIYRQNAIQNLIKYLEQYYSNIIVYIFVRCPVDFYSSGEQQMIKHRSYINPPALFSYSFRKVIEAWSNFCKVRVLKYNSKKNSCWTLCEELNINYEHLSVPEKRSNVSLSVEQMLLLEKIQKNLYQDKENVFKPHVDVIKNVQPPFTKKPVLKEPVRQLIYHNSKKDLKWLNENYGINFLQPKLEAVPSPPLPLPEFEGNKASVRDVYEVDEQSAERYEALFIDALLKYLIKNGAQTGR